MTDREQVEAAMHEYRVALGMAVNDVANGASVRDAAAKRGISKSTIHACCPTRGKIGNRTAWRTMSWKFPNICDSDVIGPAPEKQTPARCTARRGSRCSGP